MPKEPRVWTLTPYNTAPSRVEAVMADLPELKGELRPGLGNHGEVSGTGIEPPAWMLALAREYEARGIAYDID